jgi:hypothetical protein
MRLTNRGSLLLPLHQRADKGGCDHDIVIPDPDEMIRRLFGVIPKAITTKRDE